MPELSLFTGISTVFGLIGAILFVILKTQNSSNKSILTPELINALKSTNINSEDLIGLSPQKIRLILENQTNISRELIMNISKEVDTKTLILKVTMFSSFGLAILFFIISQISFNNPDKINQGIIDTTSTINPENNKGNTETDPELNTLDYNKKSNNSDNNNDESNKEVEFIIKGTIADTEGEPIENASVKLISDNDTISLITGDNGFYETSIKSNNEELKYKIHVIYNNLKKTATRTFFNNKTASQITIE